VIVGDEDHPEVGGLMGFASAGGLAVSNADAIEAIDSAPIDREICVVAQTTQEEQTFEKVVEILKSRHDTVHVYNTICDSTRKRQVEVSRMAQHVDFIVVVGGKGSGNTRRLAKVAQAQGVPSLHIETDEDIPAAALAGVQTVGVTAGASTPNWQIRRVIGKLREIGMSRAAGPLRTLRAIGDIAVMTYCWAAMAGAGLTATCLVLQGRRVTWLPLAVTTLFVFSMHLFNRLQERAGAVRFNTPEIASFYTRHRSLLTGLGVFSSIAAVALSFRMGVYACAMLVAMLATGMMYTIPIVSKTSFPRMKWRSLKDLPGSKTPLVAAGWAVSAAVLPVIGAEREIYWPGLLVAFVVASGMVFWRTALSDLLDVQGDRIVGRETIPILIGIKDTRKLLAGLLVFLALLLAVAARAGWIPVVGYWLILNTLVFAVLFRVYRGGHTVDRLSFEAMTDGNFLLAGLFSMVCGAS
jgi:4-hydroxy-3-methylbut-2-enyl diphosphate reductase